MCGTECISHLSRKCIQMLPSTFFKSDLGTSLRSQVGERALCLSLIINLKLLPILLFFKNIISFNNISFNFLNNIQKYVSFSLLLENRDLGRLKLAPCCTVINAKASDLLVERIIHNILQLLLGWEEHISLSLIIHTCVHTHTHTYTHSYVHVYIHIHSNKPQGQQMSLPLLLSSLESQKIHLLKTSGFDSTML